MEHVQQPMDVDHPNETAIVNASKSHLLELDQQYNCCGIAVDLYQFSYDPTNHWNQGHIFNANSVQDLTFNGMIEATDASNKREASFLVHEADQQDAIEDMVERSLTLKHVGIMRPLVAGYNAQVSKVISAFRLTDHLTLSDWLNAEREKPSSTSIPPVVQDLIRTAYQAIVEIWQHGYTSDSFADVSSYHMIDNRIKIDPMRIRDRRADEDDEMLPRGAFGTMITLNIYSVWQDDELVDFVHLLKNPVASVGDILGAPVLLLPARRELMYHDYAKSALGSWQLTWLQANANPKAGWKDKARNEDPALKAIIDRQARLDMQNIGFMTDFRGALHFAKVVTVATHISSGKQDRASQVLTLKVELIRYSSSCYLSCSVSATTPSLNTSMSLRMKMGLLTRRYNSDYALGCG